MDTPDCLFLLLYGLLNVRTQALAMDPSGRESLHQWYVLYTHTKVIPVNLDSHYQQSIQLAC